MNDPNLYGYPQGEAPESPQPRGPGMAGYKFSADELRVLKECNNESFFQRSLPLGTAMGLFTYSAVQKGMLKPNARFGAAPKITLAVVVGYFLGKLSYQEACAQKLMALPGSYIGQLLREKKEGRGGSYGSQRPPRTPISPGNMLGAGPDDIYSDAGPGTSLDLDTERPFFKGDDSYRPHDQEAMGRDKDGPQPPKGGGGVLSYDELRRKNRGEYTESRQDPYRMDPNVVPPISRPRQPPPKDTKPTNQYGDSIE